MSTPSRNLARDRREDDLRWDDVAKIAQEGAQHGLRFAGAHTRERGSRYWVLRLRAPDGTLHRIDSQARWQALLDACEQANPAPTSAE